MTSDASAPGPRRPPRLDPRWKVLYLVGVTAGALAVPQSLRPFVVPGLLLIQIVLLLALGVSPRDAIRMTTRLKGLFLFLGLCYLLLPAPAGDAVVALPLGLFDWSLSLNLTGLGTAAVMCGQILTVILASAVVRRSGPETDLAEALQKLRCPRLLVYSIDNTLSLLGGLDRQGRARGRGQGGGGGKGDGSGGGRGRAAPPDGAPAHVGPGFWAIARRLLRGDAGFLVDAIKSGMDRAAERGQGTMSPAARSDRHLVHDVRVISGIALLLMSMKILKVLPGVAFASGHKSLVVIPLYILAAQLTHSRFGATTAGTIMGLLGYLNGDGRYGALEILKHVVPGLAIDLLWPLFRRLPRRIWIYSVLGIIAALCRLSTELMLAFLLGARWEVFLGLTWRVISNLLAGTLSGGVTYVLLPAFREFEPGPREDSPPSQPARAEAEIPAPDGAPGFLLSEPPALSPKQARPVPGNDATCPPLVEGDRPPQVEPRR